MRHAPPSGATPGPRNLSRNLSACSVLSCSVPWKVFGAYRPDPARAVTRYGTDWNRKEFLRPRNGAEGFDAIASPFRCTDGNLGGGTRRGGWREIRRAGGLRHGGVVFWRGGAGEGRAARAGKWWRDRRLGLPKGSGRAVAEEAGVFLRRTRECKPEPFLRSSE